VAASLKELITTNMSGKKPFFYAMVFHVYSTKKLTAPVVSVAIM
jgi:hypothetical protein